MFTRILVPTDGSALSEKAVGAAVGLARQTGGRIVGISVVEPYPYAPALASAYAGGSEAFQQRLHESALHHVSMIDTAARAAGVACETHIAESSATHEEIINAAQRFGCDMIFMASHGHTGLSRLFAGSTTQKVLALTRIPVMVYR